MAGEINDWLPTRLFILFAELIPEFNPPEDPSNEDPELGFNILSQ